MLICQKNNSRDSTSSLNSQQKPELWKSSDEQWSAGTTQL